MRRNNRLGRLLPPNVDPDRTASAITGATALGVLASGLWFLIRYSGDCQDLYTYVGMPRKRVLIEGAKIAPFSDYAVCALEPLALFALVIAVWAVSLYGSFSQGSRSLYLMHRLPEGRKLLTGYVVKAPLVCLAGAAVVCALLLGIYYLVWRLLTPEICLPI